MTHNLALSQVVGALLLVDVGWELRNSHSCRQMGQESLALVVVLVDDVNLVLIHCKWKACKHFPQTTGQSSPGYLTPGHTPSKAFWQIEHTSSCVFDPHVQWATLWKRLIRTFKSTFVVGAAWLTSTCAFDVISAVDDDNNAEPSMLLGWFMIFFSFSCDVDGWWNICAENSLRRFRDGGVCVPVLVLVCWLIWLWSLLLLGSLVLDTVVADGVYLIILIRLLPMLLHQLTPSNRYWWRQVTVTVLRI